MSGQGRADALRARYVRLLLAYPKRWRDHRQEEVLALLIEVAQDEGRDRPAGAEALNLLVHGLLARGGACN